MAGGGPLLPAQVIVQFTPMADGLAAVSDGRVIKLNADADDPYVIGCALLREARRLAQKLIG